MGKPVILVVEDEEAVREVTVASLQASGAAIVEAETAEEALVKLDGGLEPDLVITDVLMRGKIDGLALGMILQERMPAISVIYITGYTGLSELPEALGNGRLLRKPCRIAELTAIVEVALAGRF